MPQPAEPSATRLDRARIVGNPNRVHRALRIGRNRCAHAHLIRIASIRHFQREPVRQIVADRNVIHTRRFVAAVRGQPRIDLKGVRGSALEGGKNQEMKIGAKEGMIWVKE